MRILQLYKLLCVKSGKLQHGDVTDKEGSGPTATFSKGAYWHSVVWLE